MHIVVLRFSSLGDIVLNSSLPLALKRQWGGQLTVTWMTSRAFAPLLEGHRGVDHVVAIERKKGLAGVRELLQAFRGIAAQRPVDLLLDLHNTLRSLVLRCRFPALPRLVVDKRSFERWLLTTAKLDVLSRQSPDGPGPGRGEWLLARNVRDFAWVFRLPGDPWAAVGEGDGRLSGMPQQREALLAPLAAPYIVLVPSASFPEKRWPLENFLAVTEMMLQDPVFASFSFVVTAGPQDSFCQAFEALAERFAGRLLNWQGKTSLQQTVSLVAGAHFVIGNDTGVPHLAEACGTPALFILGPTGEEFGFFPHLPESQVASVKLWCRPCTTNGKGFCLRSQRFCLTRVAPEWVFQKAQAMAQRSLS